jgi:hypothetical protein
VPFTVNDVRDLIQLLRDHPEWRDELRPVILGDDFNRLPDAIRELVEAQRRTEQHVEALAERVGELAEAQRRTEQRLEELADAQRRTQQQLDRVAVAVEKLTIRVDGMDGKLTELRFRDRVPSYFGTILRRPRLVPPTEIDEVEEALEDGRLTPDDYAALLRLDAIVRGGDKREPGRPDTLIAIEVSVTIDVSDVERARDRAAILRAAGLRAFGAVGGESIRPRAEELARTEGVLVRLD